MLWLIQRDFLEGKTVQQMVSEALSAVPNPSRNPDIAQVLHTLRGCSTTAAGTASALTQHQHPNLMLALRHCGLSFLEWWRAA